MPNGVKVAVVYMDRAALLRIFGYRPPGHPARKRIGWYWHAAEAAEPRRTPDHFGPFTSSRLAMQDAIKRNGGNHG